MGGERKNGQTMIPPSHPPSFSLPPSLFLPPSLPLPSSLPMLTDLMSTNAPLRIKTDMKSQRPSLAAQCRAVWRKRQQSKQQQEHILSGGMAHLYMYTYHSPHTCHTHDVIHVHVVLMCRGTYCYVCILPYTHTVVHTHTKKHCVTQWLSDGCTYILSS